MSGMNPREVEEAKQAATDAIRRCLNTMPTRPHPPAPWCDCPWCSATRGLVLLARLSSPSGEAPDAPSTPNTKE